MQICHSHKFKYLNFPVSFTWCWITPTSNVCGLRLDTWVFHISQIWMPPLCTLCMLCLCLRFPQMCLRDSSAEPTMYCWGTTWGITQNTVLGICLREFSPSLKRRMNMNIVPLDSPLPLVCTSRERVRSQSAHTVDRPEFVAHALTKFTPLPLLGLWTAVYCSKLNWDRDQGPWWPVSEGVHWGGSGSDSLYALNHCHSWALSVNTKQ